MVEEDNGKFSLIEGKSSGEHLAVGDPESVCDSISQQEAGVIAGVVAGEADVGGGNDRASSDFFSM